MKLAGIVRDSIVDGVGIRDVVFLQGCEHRCKGCHNPATWNLMDGKEMLAYDVAMELENSDNDITISGGEPLLQWFSLHCLLHFISESQPNKRIWLYTGYKYEDIISEKREILAKYVDVLVDGRFEEDKKDTKLLFRGSSNQRLIDLPASVKNDEIILWEDSNGRDIL